MLELTALKGLNENEIKTLCAIFKKFGDEKFWKLLRLLSKMGPLTHEEIRLKLKHDRKIYNLLNFMIRQKVISYVPENKANKKSLRRYFIPQNEVISINERFKVIDSFKKSFYIPSDCE